MCCAVDVIEDAKDSYGPEGSKINTSLPFTVQIDFHKSNEKFNSYTITLKQDDRIVELKTEAHAKGLTCPSDNLAHTTDDLKEGMVIAMRRDVPNPWIG